MAIYNRKKPMGRRGLGTNGKKRQLLPTNNHFSELVVQDCHQRVFHNGTRETLNLLRQSYWLPKGREIVKKLVRRCFLCRKLEGLPFKTIFCPDLPPCRVDEGPPFANTGVDFAGPLILSYTIPFSFHIGLVSYRIGLLFTRERTNPICFIPFSRFQMRTL